MDALMCDEGSVWDPSPRTRQDAAAMCRAVSRVLKPGGCFLQISFAQPHFRKRYLESNFPVDEDDDQESSRSSSTTGAAASAKGTVEAEASSLSSSSEVVAEEARRGGNGYGWSVSHEAVGEAGCLESYVYLCVKDGQSSATTERNEQLPCSLPPAPPPLLRQVS